MLGIITKRMVFWQIRIVFLAKPGIIFEKKFTTLFIATIFMDGYMLMASIDDIFTSSF